jgi:hypothetical protein
VSRKDILMPYNISNWKTKRLENFCIDWDALFAFPDLDILGAGPNGGIRIGGFSEGFCLEGKQDDSRLIVSKIESWGEYSGTSFEALLKLLEYSSGTMEAVLVWEGGDSIQRLVVIDSEWELSEIEL